MSPAVMSERGEQLLEYLPPFLRQDPTVRAVIDAQARELEWFEDAVESARAQAFPQTADLALALWELWLGLAAEPAGQTAQQRRDVVLVNLLKIASSGTGLEWEANMAAFFGSGWKYREWLPVEQRAENLVTNPSAEVDTSGWDTVAGARINTGATLTRVTTQSLYEAASLQVATPGGTALQGADYNLAVEAGKTYQIGVWAKGAAGGEAVRINAGDGTVGSASSAVVPLTTGWQRLTLAWTPTASGTSGVAVAATGTAAVTFYLDGFLIAAAGELPDYFDGGFADYEWTGAAHASTSRQRSSSAPYVIDVSVPYGPASPQYAAAQQLARAITPSHLEINFTSAGGFYLGADQLGDPL